jgi:hypothetical protein
MRTWLVAAVSALASVAVAASPAAPTAPVLGIALDGGQGHLARLDADTLRPLRTSTFLTNGYTVAPALSPDGATVALGSTSFIGVRLVDIRSLRLKAEVRLRLSGAHVVASAWPSRTRLVVAAVRGNPATVVFVTVDPARGKVVNVRRLSGTPVRAARTADGLAVLVAPAPAIGRARLAVASPAALHVWPVPVQAGRANGRQTIPALAADPAGGSAYIVDPADRLTQIDLATGKSEQRALVRRGLAKGLNGPQRVAVRLANGRLAVTGSNDSFRLVDGREVVDSEPAGLELVDIGGGTTRMLDRETSQVALGSDALIALGTSEATPMRAYAFDGSPRFELDLAAGDWVQVAGDRAYVGRRIVDLASGHVIGQAAAEPRVVLLATDGSGFPL